MAASPKTFVYVLTEFLEKLAEHFPGDEGARRALATLGMFGEAESVQAEVVRSWAALSLPLVDALRRRDDAAVAAGISGCGNALISGIGAQAILATADPATKEAVYRYLETLTALSQVLAAPAGAPAPPAGAPAPAPAPPTGAPAPAFAPPTGAPAPAFAPPTGAPAPPAGAPARPNAGEVVKQITQSLPEIFKSLNEVMKAGGEDNPLGQMLQSIMNPGALNTSLGGNLAANLMENDPGSVMAQVGRDTGLTADEIMRKLKRLDNFERARARRNKNKD